MKRLLILRHAKAKPDDPDGDWSRRLSKRGHRDAETIGHHIQATYGRPDLIVTSDAVRARQTAVEVAEAVGIAEEAVELEPRLYQSIIGELLDVIRMFPDSADTVVFVGHNPDLEELAAGLGGIDPSLVRLPTAGLACLDLEVDHWGQTVLAVAEWQGVVTP